MESSREILDRQARLIARAQVERERIAAGFDRLRPYASLGDRAIRLGRGLAAHPEWPLIAIGAVAVFRPRWLWRAARRAWIVWRVWSAARGLLRSAIARAR
jgi:hypothetical protein